MQAPPEHKHHRQADVNVTTSANGHRFEVKTADVQTGEPFEFCFWLEASNPASAEILRVAFLDALSAL